MGRIMVNGENFSGSEVVANPTLAGTETNLTGLEVDGTKYAVSGGGGGFNKTVLWDSGSYSSGAIIGQTYNLSDNLSNYDICYIVYASMIDRQDPQYANTIYTSFIVDDLLNETYPRILVCGFGERHRFIDFTDTTFTVRNAGNNYDIFKIIGVKF